MACKSGRRAPCQPAARVLQEAVAVRVRVRIKRRRQRRVGRRDGHLCAMCRWLAAQEASKFPMSTTGFAKYVLKSCSCGQRDEQQKAEILIGPQQQHELKTQMHAASKAMYC